MIEENWDDPSVPMYVCPDTSRSNDSGVAPKSDEKSQSRIKFEPDWRNKQVQNKDRTVRRNDNFFKTAYNKNKETHMQVQVNKVGLLIGRQGSKIRELEEKSRARIKICGYCGEDNCFQRVIITGDEESRKKCSKLIEELTSERKIEIVYGRAPQEPVPDLDWEALGALADKAEAEKWARCPRIKKNFYVESPIVAAMTPDEVESFRKENCNIIVQEIFGGDGKILNPVSTFEQAFAPYPGILREIKKQGFKHPSPIQSQAWPILLSGRDLIGIAQTGTGKTLAFLLPALIHIDGQRISRSKRQGANVLIVAPTRELALQIEDEVQKYSYKNIKSVCLYGGANRREQMQIVKKGVELIIATPGRLNDLINSKVVNLNSITYFVLDEADRMLDMGFEPQIRKVLLDIRPDRQSVMTSATWPSRISDLAKKYMCNPVHVCIGSLNLTAVHSVAQTVLIVKEHEKKDYLLDFIRNLTEDDKLIVFVSKKIVADHLSCDLSLDRILCQSIHGDRDQMDREQAIHDFKDGTVKILIATDVASRGIDISDVTKVVNYDFPTKIEEYVHRVGRTGRAGNKGEAVTFFTWDDGAYAEELIKIMEEANQPVPQDLYHLKEKFTASNKKDKPKRYGKGGGGGGGGGTWNYYFSWN